MVARRRSLFRMRDELSGHGTADLSTGAAACDAKSLPYKHIEQIYPFGPGSA